MFTGIIAEAGLIHSLAKAPDDGTRLVVSMQRSALGLKTGDSIAVNGCCLTAVRIARQGRRRLVHFDLLQETWRRTNLQFARPGGRVNLERPLRAGGTLDGHFVTGHIDGLGRITRWERSGADHLLEIQAPPQVRRYVIEKGSIAVDGISLTVAGVTRTGFRIWIIPHTWAATALQERKQGDAVNLEADLLGKYVEQLLSAAPLKSRRAPLRLQSRPGRKPGRQ